MKGSEQFKKTIQEYLEKKAAEEPDFNKTFHKEGKNIDDCIKYIFNTVKESGANGFTDEEIYLMAIYYYDEDKLDIKDIKDMQVIVNHQVQLTEEEKKEAREKAKKKVEDEAYSEMKRKSAPKKKEESKVEQKTLF